MKRLFLAITKGEEIRFLGHLDYLRTMERVVVRSGIPIAFSEGFNPHMKISLDSALAVGVTADPLYMEIKLEKDMPIEEVKERMQREMPKGMTIYHIEEAAQEWPKFVAFFNEDAYEMEGPVTEGADAEAAKEAIARFNALPSFIYQRVTPKKVREMDVKPMISREKERISPSLSSAAIQVRCSLRMYGRCLLSPSAFHGCWMPSSARVPGRIGRKRGRERRPLIPVSLMRGSKRNETDTAPCDRRGKGACCPG